MAKNDNATEGTFSAAPFISFDGADENGNRAEVKVVVGYGDVVSVVDSANGKTKKVEFAVSNTKFNPSGWTRSPQLQALIAKAQETNEPIHFRLETRRKEGIDRATPIGDLGGLATAKDSIVKSLAAVKLEGDEDWTLSADAVTRIDEDPNTGGLYNANTQPKAEKPSARNENSGNSRNGAFEPAPYVAIWKDKVNPGTTAVAVPINFLTTLLEHSRQTGLTIERDRLKEIALTLMKIANLLQKDIYVKHLQVDYPGLDLTAGSHTRARALIFETMRSFAPLTENELNDEQAFAKWQKTIYTTAYSIWVWGMESVEEYIL